jgi:hypothetical protein
MQQFIFIFCFIYFLVFFYFLFLSFFIYTSKYARATYVFLKTFWNAMEMSIELSIYNKGRCQVLVRFDQVVYNKIQI